MVPPFLELLPYLQDAYKLAPKATSHVIARHRNANYRTRLLKIIKRAGLKPWPRPFHNLRATRQTELEEAFPSHVVCEWIGNSKPVADKHYLQVTDDHFERAAGSGALPYALPSKSADARKASQPRPAVEKTRKKHAGRRMASQKVGDEGLELVRESARKRRFRMQR